MPEKYHLRRKEKEITDKTEINEIIFSQAFMTIAMCSENRPYLVSLNYGYDADAQILYFHCAKAGKKLDFLRDNPRVWGQIIEDNGYIKDECSHAFRSVEFEGIVDFLESFAEKKHALDVMIDHIEPNPESLKKRMVNEKRVAGVTIGRIKISDLTAKENK
jgi:nitroimidazol reductase NimA-like FMN-containing flavoprotein (pyridoxamine 5'-phosphate oxidase superfamily)